MAEITSAPYYTARVAAAPNLPIPDDKRLTRGWHAFPVAPSGSTESTQLVWDDLPLNDLSSLPDLSRFRVAVALDEREEKLLKVSLTHSGEVIGVLDIRFAHIFQPFEITITRSQAEQIAAQGVSLRLIKGEHPLWLLHDPSGGSGLSAPLMPHLLGAVTEPPLEAFYKRLASLASLQFFGWQEGCVLNGLTDLAEAGILAELRVQAVASRHFEFFFDSEGRLSYEDDWSRPREGQIYGIECTLPFAVLAKLQPEHPALPEAAQFWRGLLSADGTIQDADMLSAEGCYTVAYPMVVLAKVLDQGVLAEIALQQLRLRQKYLATDNAIFLRYHPADLQESHSFRNWCRGVTWYMLGLARTLRELPTWFAADDLRDEFRRVAAWIVGHQLESGLWAVFVDEPDTPPDTSGSAGIATALAMGVKLGVLPESYLTVAQHTLEGLLPHLTPDGFLGGVAQVNKFGESLQRSPYRVISQMGMGLMAQLIAALK